MLIRTRRSSKHPLPLFHSQSKTTQKNNFKLFKMSQDKQECCDANDANDEDIRPIEGSELETANIGTIGDGNAQGNDSISMNSLLLEANQAELGKLKEDDGPIIQAIQEKINESAQEMATQNAEDQKQEQELEEKHQQKEMTELEAEILEKNTIAKQTTSLKEELQEKINLIMGKKLVVNPAANATGNCWKKAKHSKNSICTDGLNATNSSNATIYQSVSAQKGFAISVDFCGPVLFYFEVTNMSSHKGPIFVGLSSSGDVPDGTCVGDIPNSYAMQDGCDHCWLSEKKHYFEWPNGLIKPEWNGEGDVLGCGLLLNPENKLSIFFTGNGILMGRKIPIKPTVDLLYPTITLYGNASVKANFGEDLAKQFKYDIQKCAGLIFK